MVGKEVALEAIPRTASKSRSPRRAVPGENWESPCLAKSGNPVYERPVVLVLYRTITAFLLDQVIPSRVARWPNTIW